MKKISIFILSSLFALTLSATDSQPMVRINTSNNNYEVSIDGANYYGNSTIPNLNQGTHAVQVYEVRKGLFGKRRTLVSSSNFQLYNNDVNIFVDANGQVRINESGNYNNNDNTEKRNRGRTDNDWNNGNNNSNDDVNNDNRNYKNKKAKHNNGNGNKRGHYKKNQ